MEITNKARQEAQKWLESKSINEEHRAKIRYYLQHSPEDLEERFGKSLDFGTGGLRGLMGIGTNRLNIFTVRRISYALTLYINNTSSSEDNSIAIAYDCRNFSQQFAQESACVFATHNISVYLFQELTPTPLLSYAIQYYGTKAGVVITASHNPPQYNGYKVFSQNGGQLVSPVDKEIAQYIEKVDTFEVQTKEFHTLLENGKIQYIQPPFFESYYSYLDEICIGNKEDNRLLNVLYTPLHGTGTKAVSYMMKKRNFVSFRIVKEQADPDGNFSTLQFPNPEEESAYQLAISSANENDEVILATDPDADRLGAVVKRNNEWERINGNVMGQVLLYFYLQRMQKNNQLPKKGLYVSTIVTSELGKKIAQSYNVSTVETLTGFKYIAQVMEEVANSNEATFLFGMEESHGYLWGDKVRDKDGVMASVMFAEVLASLKKEKVTFFDYLESIYQQYGYHYDCLYDKTYQGLSGTQKISSIIEKFRITPPLHICGQQVIKTLDYQKQTIKEEKNILPYKGLPISNVIAYYLKNGSRLTLRPSGTEPKLKIYFNICGFPSQEKNILFAKELTTFVDEYIQ